MQNTPFSNHSLFVKAKRKVLQSPQQNSRSENHISISPMLPDFRTRALSGPLHAFPESLREQPCT
jgi:hypothetical protein